jgi:hypothetical protein
MNRKQRRPAGMLPQQQRNRAKQIGGFYKDYLQHLPEVPLDTPPERGHVYHVCYFHDDSCRFFETNDPADCNCNSTVRQHVEPRRS